MLRARSAPYSNCRVPKFFPTEKKMFISWCDLVISSAYVPCKNKHLLFFSLHKKWIKSNQIQLMKCHSIFTSIHIIDSVNYILYPIHMWNVLSYYNCCRCCSFYSDFLMNISIYMQCIHIYVLYIYIFKRDEKSLIIFVVELRLLSWDVFVSYLKKKK